VLGFQLAVGVHLSSATNPSLLEVMIARERLSYVPQLHDAE
jgi:hypothetical protein